MTIPDSSSFGVWLGSRRAGTILRIGDRTRFSLDLDYREDPNRPVLGLVFEDRPERVHVATVRLTPWFSNLLPEGRLRDWIALERGVNRKREIELLAHVGHDLPGAVRVLPKGEVPIESIWSDEPDTYSIEIAEDFHQYGVRFSLAGVAMKFSMLMRNDRLTIPAHGEGGDWIVKTPDSRFRDVPLNEFAMMSLAHAVGIEVPETRLIPRERVDDRLPASLWPEHENFAYAIRRFDRDEHRNLVHIEDLAQVRNVYPERKYDGNFETVANLIYRGRDREALLEFVRRLTFSVLISNGDYHLKNCSLIYRDSRVPTLAPAYDLVSTAHYSVGERPEDLGLKFGGSRNFHQVTLTTFRRLQERLGADDVDLAECAAATVERTLAEWPLNWHILDSNPRLQESVNQSIAMRSKTIMRHAESLPTRGLRRAGDRDLAPGDLAAEAGMGMPAPLLAERRYQEQPSAALSVLASVPPDRRAGISIPHQHEEPGLVAQQPQPDQRAIAHASRRRHGIGRQLGDG